MAIIEPSRLEIERPSRIKRYAPSLRLWHWINLVAICGSLVTVLINSTITDDKTTSVLIKQQLNKSGGLATNEQVRSVAHSLSDNVWGIHIYFGYALTLLLGFRLILEFFQLADQKFIRRIKKAYQQFNTNKERQLAKHELTVKMIYAAFYLLLIIMVVTGLFLAFEDALSAYKSIRHPIKEIHGFCMYLILAFISVHIAGVILAERKQGHGIVSDMINGGNEVID